VPARLPRGRRGRVGPLGSIRRPRRSKGQKELIFGDARLALVEGVFILRATNLTRAPLIAIEVSEEEARPPVLARDTARGRAPRRRGTSA
jgi:hypothetical protein